MNKRPAILLGMAAGALWACGVIEAGRRLKTVYDFPHDVSIALIFALLPGGLVLIALIGRLAARRFFDDTLIDGQPLVTPADQPAGEVYATILALLLALTIFAVEGAL